MSDLIVRPVALVGGLEDSKAKPEPSDFTKLENFAIFRGRFALRAPFSLVQETGFLDDQSPTPAAITHLLAVTPHNSKMYVVGYSSGQQKVYLYELNSDGTSPTRVGTFIWSGVTTAPRPILASFQGGSATSGTTRLYIADYDGQQVTKFWDGTTIQTLQVDFDASGVAEDVKFHYVLPFQFHLWGAGFFQGTTARSEMLRFSRPGLIPENDPDDNPATGNVEWFVNDFRPVGTRGQKVTNMNLSGGGMVVFKDRQVYVLFGYDSQSWAIKLLTDRSGSVGPYASATDGDGSCFFWSERGPHATEGEGIYDISESVRKHVLEVEVSDEVVTAFSPDDGLVYFIYPRGGSVDPDRWLAFDKVQKRWTEGEWLRTGGGILVARHAFPVPSTVLPGPLGAPSALAVTTVDEDEQDLTWTNGDIALDTATEIYRDTASPATTFITSLGSGIASYRVSGLTAKTTYFYRARHKRNAQFSAYSNEVSAKTTLSRPTALSASRLSNGIRVQLTNNEALADVVIERRLITDASFSVLTTLLAQAAGTVTFDDTTATCDLQYEFRAKVTKAGETDSPYSDKDISYACRPADLTAASHTILLASCSIALVLWTGTSRREDRVRVSRSLAGAAYTVQATRSFSAFHHTDSVPWKPGSDLRSLQYKLEALDDGNAVVDTLFTTLSNHSVADCP